MWENERNMCSRALVRRNIVTRDINEKGSLLPHDHNQHLSCQPSHGLKHQFVVAETLICVLQAGAFLEHDQSDKLFVYLFNNHAPHARALYIGL